MKLRTIVETAQDQVDELANKHKLEPTEIIRITKEYGDRYWKWVLNQWYLNKIRLPEDGHRVKETLENFHKTKSRLQERDINKYKSLSDIEQIVEPLLGITSSNKTIINYEEFPGVEVISQNGPYVTLKVRDPDSLAELGTGTKWCTRKDYPDCQAENYIADYSYVFIMLQDGRPVMQYTPDYEQIMDINDNPIKDKKLLSLIPKPQATENSDFIDDFIGYINHITLKIGERCPEAEPIILNITETGYDRSLLMKYIKRVIKGRWPEAEPIIIKHTEHPMWDANIAYEYVVNFFGGKRWLEAEPVIMQDPQYAYFYARDVIKGRWPEAEPFILQNEYSTIEYAKNFFGGRRWSEAEPIIMQNPRLACQYTQSVIKPEAEMNGRSGRWPEAEPTIMKNPYWAYEYAKNVIGGRWPEAEPYIAQNKDSKRLYERDIKK